MTGLKHEADFRQADVGKIELPVRPIKGRAWRQLPQAFRATKTALEMRNTVSRVEECEPCVTGVGPSRRLHVTVLVVLCTHCGVLQREYEAAFERFVELWLTRGGAAVA